MGSPPKKETLSSWIQPPRAKRGALAFAGDPTHQSRRKTCARAEAGGKKRHFYKPLPKEFRKNGFNYRQFMRDGDAAIYERTWNGCPNPSISYEVIRVRYRDGFHISGRFVEPAAVYPNSEAWGADGWTLLTLDAAFGKLRALRRQR